METVNTLEFLGATTFRLRACGLTIFHDAWLDRPTLMPKFLDIRTVSDVDYIFISHAHFDHLPGADQIAIKTGATIIANCEAINCLREAGVPDAQLIPVAGGERIPLFTRDIREKAAAGTVPLAPGLPGVPRRPDLNLAAASVHVWPSLHCLLPGNHDEVPEVFDTGKVYTGEASPFECTLDITTNMKYGLLRLKEIVPEEHMDDKMRCLANWLEDRKSNVLSNCDGGQLMFNVLLGDKTLLFNAHLGAYEGIVSRLQPKPDLAILGIAGRANLDGRPFNGSGAMFATKLSKWLGEPERIIWCLHDDSLIKPYYVDTKAATSAVEAETKSQVISLPYAKPYKLW